jgi:hypothetical protein
VGAVVVNSGPSKRAARSTSTKSNPTTRGGGRLSQGGSIRRQKLIVDLHDREHWTFARIAAHIGMGEKECRQAYHRFIREVAPELNSRAGDEKVAEHLRLLEEIVQQLRRVAASADNDSARVGAVRELIRVVQVELTLRQNLGLLPRPPQSIPLEREKAWIGQQVAQLLRDLAAPPEAIARLERILSGGEA